MKSTQIILYEQAANSVVRDLHGCILHYKCKFCSKEIKRQDYFKVHVHRQHFRELNIEQPTKTIECTFEQCKSKFFSRGELNSHIRNKHRKSFDITKVQQETTISARAVLQNQEADIVKSPPVELAIDLAINAPLQSIHIDQSVIPDLNLPLSSSKCSSPITEHAPASASKTSVDHSVLQSPEADIVKSTPVDRAVDLAIDAPLQSNYIDQSIIPDLNSLFPPSKCSSPITDHVSGTSFDYLEPLNDVPEPDSRSELELESDCIDLNSICPHLTPP